MHTIGLDDKYLKGPIADYSKPGVIGSAFNNYLRKSEFLKKISNISAPEIISFKNKFLKVSQYFLDHLTKKKYTVYRGMAFDGLEELLKNSNIKIETSLKPVTSDPIDVYELDLERKISLINEINEKKPIVFDEGFMSTALTERVSAESFDGKTMDHVFLTIEIPAGSKALVLDYEGITNVPDEEEMLLAERTKLKINSAKVVGNHYEIEAAVVK